MEPSFRQALRTGRPLIGSWKQLPDAVGGEVVGRAGFDWVGIDTQHGMIGFESMLAILQALSIAGVPALVRVSQNDPAEIGRALDAGAAGVIVPFVNTAVEAAAAVRACRYAPAGGRSWGPVRASMAIPGYSPQAGNDAAICIAMIETLTGLENAEQIVSVEGLDAVYVGPSDLAVSAGLTPTLLLDDPQHRKLVDTIVRTCKAHGLAAGTHTPTPGHAAEYRDWGFNLLIVHGDLTSLRSTALRSLEAARGERAVSADSRTGY